MSLKKILNCFVGQINFKNSLIKFNFSTVSTFYNKPRTHDISNKYYAFSTLKNDKNPMQSNNLQSKSKNNTEQIPILKEILELSSQKQLQSIYKKLNFMTKQHRQIALKYLLSAIFTGKIPLSVVQSEELNVLLKQFSQLKMQSQLFLINNVLSQLKHKKKNKQGKNQKSVENENQASAAYNKLNDLFLNAFNKTLKQLPQQYMSRNKAILYKHFAQYNFQFLFSSQVKADCESSQFKENYSFLKKSRDFLTESLIYHKQIILSQYKKLQSEDINELKENDKQRYYIKINAIKQNIRKLVQSIGECLHAIVIITYKQFKWTNDIKKFNQNKLQASSLIESYISLYSIFGGIKPLSKSYFQLRSIGVDCKATALAAMASNPQLQNNLTQVRQKFKDTLAQSMSIYHQCQECLPEVAQYFDNLKQLAAVMLNLKYKIGKNKHHNSQTLKKQLALVVHDILQKVKPEWKKPTQVYLLKLLKEIMKRQETIDNLMR